MLEGIKEASCNSCIDGCKFHHSGSDPVDALVRPDHLVIAGHRQKKCTGPRGLGDVEAGSLFLDIDHSKDIFIRATRHDTKVIGIATEMAMPFPVELFQHCAA